MSNDIKSSCESAYSRAKNVAHDQDIELEYFDDSAGERFKPLPPEELFVRGLIEIRFKRSARSGLEAWNFREEKQREKFSNVWPPQLVEILGGNKLVSWKPSFPLQYPWSPAKSKKSALASYIEAGRDKFVTLNFPQGADVVSIAKQLRQLPEIEEAVAIPEIGPPSTPLTEPLIDGPDQGVTVTSSGDPISQWYLFRCDVPEAWDLSVSGQGVVIADIDWGFNLTHQDMPLPGLTRSTFIDSVLVNHGSKRDHGTAVLGLAGARVNDRGIVGIAFDSTLWAIQAGTDTITDYVYWARAINLVRSTRTTARKVIILEVQTRGLSNIEAIPSIREEIIAAINDGIVVCVPAGNGNRFGDAGINDTGDPIPRTGSILVGATRYDPRLNVISGSNGGNRIVVYAPGDSDSDLTCGSPPNGYRVRFGGTSGATAKVAGVVALMLEKNNQLTPQSIRDILGRSLKGVVNQTGSRIGVLLDAHQAVSDAT